MSDLISRKDVIDAVESRYTEVWEDSDVDYNNGIEAALCEIKALPSADRTGEWIEEDEYGDLLVCSECGFANDYKDDYCPSCKARMKGDTTE